MLGLPINLKIRETIRFETKSNLVLMLFKSFILKWRNIITNTVVAELSTNVHKSSPIKIHLFAINSRGNSNKIINTSISIKMVSKISHK